MTGWFHRTGTSNKPLTRLIRHPNHAKTRLLLLVLRSLESDAGVEFNSSNLFKNMHHQLLLFCTDDLIRFYYPDHQSGTFST